MGANWVQGLGSPGGPGIASSIGNLKKGTADFATENPIWTFAKKWNVSNTYSNYGNILTYNETGYTNYSSLLDDFQAMYEEASEEAGIILKENLQDQTARTGLALAGWRPKRDDMAAQAVEWWEWGKFPAAISSVIFSSSTDWEDAYSPEESSFVFGAAGDNLTFNQFSNENNLVWDQRGFNRIIHGEASTFLKTDDPRLHLNSQVTSISYTDDGVTVHMDDGSCVSAAYAVCTFSLGVLQSNTVKFNPELPSWKRTAIEKFSMGTYTKIFLQFNETFWPADIEYFLYASPTTRGYYPVWQSLSAPGFIPESNILFVTVVSQEAYRVERQSDEQTKKEVMAVLRQMYPNITVPEPTAFMYPRWSTTPWSYGSYSNWPPSTTLEMHQNFRANVNRLWFAGEATSAQYFGFLHGAWFEGRDAGRQIAALLKDKCSNVSSTMEDCGDRRYYETLKGSSPLADYTVFDGWSVSSFYSSS